MADRTSISLQPYHGLPTSDQALWSAIRNRTTAIGFDRYQRYIDCVLCKDNARVLSSIGENAAALFQGEEAEAKKRSVSSCVDGESDVGVEPCGFSFQGPYAYQILKLATQAFLLLESGIVINKKILTPEIAAEGKRWNEEGWEEKDINDLKNKLDTYLIGDQSKVSAAPYLKRIVKTFLGRDGLSDDQGLPYCNQILMNRFTCPSLIELIWSYWLEEGMLVQTMNAISLRFQNRRSSNRDPLANLEIDPLRPLNNLLWGYVQDEQHRLSIARRAYEYDHHYGLKLIGKAVPRIDSVDSRSKFLESFHNLLSRTSIFYQEEADTTMRPDGFPLLNALKEVHLLLAEGAHNQFGDLPWTSRTEMLMMQWLLFRPEMREFLRGRHMVPYSEPWMGAVDAMKKLQGWTDTPVSAFRDLAVYGEQILLSVRWGDWSAVNDQEQARNWARYWRPEIQGYTHAYRTATGVDLTTLPTDSARLTERYQQPSLHLDRRLSAQTTPKRLPGVKAEAEWLQPSNLRQRSVAADQFQSLPRLPEDD